VRIILDVQATPGKPLVEHARKAKAALERLIVHNANLIRARRVPPLYTSGVRYRKPYTAEHGGQEILDCVETLREGEGTCGDLSAWRAAELRVFGDARIGVSPCQRAKSGGCAHGFIRIAASGETICACPNVKIYWRPECRGVLHAEVRLPNGNAEDPSRFLGMRGNPFVRGQRNIET
jgi:hypothetical protein